MKNESNSSNSELNNVTESVVESSSNESKFDAYHYYGIHSINNNNNINSNNISNSKSGKYHNSLNATDDESVAELFRPGRQSLENYDLKLAHQRYNVAYDKFLGVNNVKAGIELFANIKDEGFMESLAWAACHCIRASLTLDKAEIDLARQCLRHSEKMCKKLMKNSFIENITKWVVTPNYDKYTDVEVFAQLYYAQQSALTIALYAMETNSVFTLIKLTYYLRGLLRTYNECWQIKRKRKNWADQQARVYYEAHMRIGNGIVNVVISHTPPKFLRIMSMLGYKGTESVGLNEMNKVAFEMNAGFTSKLAQLMLIYYWVYAKPHGENIPNDLSLCQKLVEAELELFPKNMMYGLAKAKIEQINGNFDVAIETLNRLLEAPNLTIAYKAFYFELVWCYAINCDWDNCIRCSEMIRSSKHSPVCTAFLNAVFRYVKGVDDGDQDLLDQATKEFEVIPSLRIRHFGKTMTTEKAALQNAQLYFKKGKRLVLPIIAMLYAGNYLMFIRSEQQLDRLMERVQRAVDQYSSDFETSKCLDDYLTTIFYKGVLYRLKKMYPQAKECFNLIQEMKSRIDLETSIVPMTTLEMGLIEIEEGNFESAKQWLDEAEHGYSNYTAENFVHLRAYAAIRRMGYKTDKEKEDKEKLNQHILNWLKFHEIDLKTYRDIIGSKSTNEPL